MNRLICILLLAGCLSGSAAAQRTVVAEVSNPAAIARMQETVELPLAAIYGLLPELRNVALSVSRRPGGAPLVSQVVDENADGTGDLLLVQADLKPHETVRLFIAAGAKQAAAPSQVDGRFVRPREDFAWENERIAFRMYGPALAAEVNSGIDVWCKRVRSLIVEKWYHGEELTPKISYHEDHGEGADFFSVGKSLGAGGAGLFVNGRVMQPGVFATHRVIANGPIRLVFELVYDSWNIGGRKLTETKRITLDAGSQVNRIDEWFISNDGTPLTIVAGLVKRPGTTLVRDPANRWMALWGPTNNDTTNGSLGTVVLMPTLSDVQAAEDSVQYLMTASAQPGTAFRYFAGAAWTRSGDVPKADAWSALAATLVERSRHPLILKFRCQ